MTESTARSYRNRRCGSMRISHEIGFDGRDHLPLFSVLMQALYLIHPPRRDAEHCRRSANVQGQREGASLAWLSLQRMETPKSMQKYQIVGSCRRDCDLAAASHRDLRDGELSSSPPDGLGSDPHKMGATGNFHVYDSQAVRRSPSAHADTHSPQPSHFVSSISTIGRRTITRFPLPYAAYPTGA